METLIKLKELGKKIRKCNILDSNIDDFLFNYIIFDNKKYNTKIFISKYLYVINMQGFDSRLSFAINKKEKVCLINKPVSKQSNEIPTIYMPYDGLEDSVINWFKNKKNIDFIKSLKITKYDALFVYKNGIMYYTSTLNNIQERIEILYNIINDIKIIDSAGNYINIENIPERLRSLIPFIKEWAISDDFLRQEKIDAINGKDKNELLEKVCPLLSEIDNYISSFKEPIPNEAILFGDLAQTVLELIKR